MVQIEKTNGIVTPIKIYINGMWQYFTKKAAIEMREKLQELGY